MSQGFRGQGEPFPPTGPFTQADVDLIRAQADNAEYMVRRMKEEVGLSDAAAEEQAAKEIADLRDLAGRMAMFVPSQDRTGMDSA